METTLSLSELDNWVTSFIASIPQKKTATIVCLFGEVGAGKTTLTQSIAQSLGIDETITSPTFVIQKEYKVIRHNWIKNMIHIDAYRLDNKQDLEYLGWDTLIQNPQNLIIIEWPEMVHGIDMPDAINLSITINDNHTRTIKTI
jgi:tRNA threonylcarbamoyladenosine biosynthesis protein TsaE